MNGPRPWALTIRESSTKIVKKSRPVVVYIRSPKIIHVRPEEFRGLVQQLTGKQSEAAAAAALACSSSSSTTTTTSSSTCYACDQSGRLCF